MRLPWLATIALLGCFSERTDYRSGEVACHPGDDACPPGLTCGFDGMCYRPGDLPDAGCTASSCVGKTPYVCTNGNLVEKSVCSVACAKGLCVACDEGSVRCSNNQAQLCDNSGAWTNAAACPTDRPRCEVGTCQPPCSPSGSTRCSPDGTGIEQCDKQGLYHVTTFCPYVCSAGTGQVSCGGSCRPGTRRCGASQTPQHCDETGAWIDEPACAGECSGDGRCSGVCRSGQTRCAAGQATQTESCGPTGEWNGGLADCPFVCLAETGACGGVCTPGSKRCSGSKTQSCDATGTWKDGTDCGSMPCTRGACGPCSDGQTQCNADVPQTCSGGVWSNQQATKCPFVCDDTSGCVGECQPGSTLCTANALRTCDAHGKYGSRTCPFVCISGQCAGSCTPGTNRCSAGTTQLCGSTGSWGSGQSCAYGCSDATGKCQDCVDDDPAVTCANGGCGDRINNCGRPVTCPTCGGMGQSCGGGGTDGFCGCTPSATGGCGGGNCGATVGNCGQPITCPTTCDGVGQTCGGGGVQGRCGCTPRTQAAACAGLDCGTVSDGCGGTVSCGGSCTGTGQTCSGGGTANRCGCTPEAASATCGSRICGVLVNNCGMPVPCGPLAGACADGKMCDSNGACVAGCVPLTQCPTGDDCGTVDPGCGQPALTCGGACPSGKPTCSSNHCTCVPLTACPTGACGAYPNGCGGTLSCGGCTNNQVCDASSSRCRDETMAEACGASNCGSVTSGGHTYTCGTCTAPFHCSSSVAGQPGTCVCTPVFDCTGKCGPIPDGCNGTHDCGGCVAPNSCGGGGVANACGCTPAANACAGFTCGSQPDGCGGTVDCDPDHACKIGLCWECDVGQCTFRTQCQ